jgi:hypothetical protein
MESEAKNPEVSTYANEVDENSQKLPSLSLDIELYGQTEETGEAYGIISVSDVCPEPNKRPTTD